MRVKKYKKVIILFLGNNMIKKFLKFVYNK